MDKSLIEKYKAEMLRMHRSTRSDSAEPDMPPLSQRTENDTAPQMTDGSGNLVAVVATLRSLYPVPNAQVTVFTGDYNDMNVLATDTTDQSGRTGVFVLPAPERMLSQSAGADSKPYASYNMLVRADGYIDNIHLNIPVFSGVTSLQRSNMMLRETAGENKGPQIFNEDEQYNL